MSKNFLIKGSLLLIIVLLFLPNRSIAEANGSKKQEKNYLSFSIALFDFIQNNSTAMEGRAEFRLYKVPILLKPLSGLMVNTDGALFIYAGLLYDIPLTSFLFITPSFSPGLYVKSQSKDLGFKLNFRSQVELSLRFENDFRFGLSFNHISNGTLGKINPGVESFSLFTQFPL